MSISTAVISVADYVEQTRKAEMERADLDDLLNKIRGCTFASLDCVTNPERGVRKVTTNERVIIFTNQHSSGYENRVRRLLKQSGKNPDSFHAGALPWGIRIPGTPLIEHVGKKRIYLQAIILHEGEAEYFLGNLNVSRPNWLREDRSGEYQGLGDRSVKVRCYNLENITAIRLMKEERPVLSVKVGGNK